MFFLMAIKICGYCVIATVQMPILRKTFYFLQYSFKIYNF